MACATCLKRKKQCDLKRPRCGPCRRLHLKCAYTRPPGVFMFVDETASQSPRHAASSPSQQSDSPAQARIQSNVVSSPVPGNPSTPLPDIQRTRVGQNTFSGMLPSPWHDDFYYDFNTEPFQDMDFGVDAGFSLPTDFAIPSQLQQTDGSMPLVITPPEANNTPTSTNEVNTANEPDTTPLPGHILAQHYSSELARKYSFKSSEWTFYTYFFHRFTQTHPWVLCSIQAWTSTHLFYSGKIKSLHSAEADYLKFVDHMKTHYGVSHKDFTEAISNHKDNAVDRQLADAAPDDIDAIFVGHFFLALADLMAARPTPFRGILRLIAHLLGIPEIKDRMTGVRSRVASWFCILDGKASAFQKSDGTVLQAIGGEDGLMTALNESYLTLQQAYSLTYPDEQRKGDAEQLPLLQRMLSLAALLHEITQLKHMAEKGERTARIRNLRTTLDTHRDTIDDLKSSGSFQGLSRARSTFLVLSALYHSVEISFSRSLCSEATRHSANQSAQTIIKLAQELTKFHPSRNTPPPTKFWPLPLVMAAIEVGDTIYREWAIDRLKSYEKVGGDHYVYATKFVELACATEDKAGARVDWEPIMASLRDGLTI